jgi:D-alanyl-D-alanine carboxypeptidase
MTHPDSARRLQAILERVTRRHPGKPPPQVLVRSPGLDLEFGGARPFHAASVGKVMTAALVGMLVDRGHLRFDDPIGKLLPGAETAELPAARGVEAARDVTVDHLLSHTGGLPDFFAPPFGHRTACSRRGITTDRDRHWTPAAMLAEVRRLPAVGRPGERFRYGDTSYVLLGRIVEEATGERFNTLLRKQVFEPTGMTHASTPYADARAPGDLDDLNVAPFWIGRHELSRALSVSIDWAGGGIVATPDDLLRFQRALHGGQLVAAGTLDHLTQPRRRMRPGIHYGAGALTVRFHEFFPLAFRGLPSPVGGVGYFATHMFFYPHLNAHVVLNFHSNLRLNSSFITHAAIARALASQA